MGDVHTMTSVYPAADWQTEPAPTQGMMGVHHTFAPVADKKVARANEPASAR